MPKGTEMRRDHEKNVRDLVNMMLDSAGKRWRRQFIGEVNFASELQMHFLTDSSDVLDTLEKREKVASQLYEFRETLPSLFHAWERKEIVEDTASHQRSPMTPKQRMNEPKGAAGKTPKTAPKAPARSVKAGDLIGVDAPQLTWRHDAEGKVHRKDEKNTHITVGKVTVSLKALASVYGENLCAAALCSLRKGAMRLKVCDCKGQPGHLTTDLKHHRLPAESGPRWDKDNWAKVVRLSKKRSLIEE